MGDHQNWAVIGEDRQAAVVNTTNYEGDLGLGNVGEEEDVELEMDSKLAFLVDYCKRGTTKCRRCKKNILQGQLRIGRSAKLKGKDIYHYFHVICAFRLFEKSRSAANTITCMDDIMGFDLIKDEEKLDIL